ncbi:MAG: GNAT family N-acetyltransferase [Clostridia bacterium]|nr:GNAT family N-acetyltransferase [Clostridia bacterium]MDR3644574.1 GNAT family N-acetyltransferase [Clostridia bacterium]
MESSFITDTQTIETPRLILRKFELSDAQAMFNNWASDSEVTRFLRWDAHQSVNVTREVLRGWVGNYGEGHDYFHWVIVLRETGLPVGAISLLNVSRRDQCAEVGYCLGRRYWGRGIMTEALRAVLEFGFLRAGFNRIEAAHSVRNPASGRVMQKAGMKHEGSLRESYRSSNGFEDCELYAALRSDLPAGAGCESDETCTLRQKSKGDFSDE